MSCAVVPLRECRKDCSLRAVAARYLLTSARVPLSRQLRAGGQGLEGQIPALLLEERLHVLDTLLLAGQLLAQRLDRKLLLGDGGLPGRGRTSARTARGA